MAQSFTLLPSGDIENDGWALVGSNVTEVWEVIGTLIDDCYVRSPQYRGSATVSFPIDSEDLPAGAIIDSVTVIIRMKTNAGSGPRTVTVNVLSSENMSRYTSRTLQATSAFTTHEVGTYTKDPMGKSWDIHRINKLRLRVYCLNDLFDAIQISQLYVRVNYHVRPKVVVTAPTGTSVSPSPLVKWNYTHEEGEPQSKAQIKVFTAQQVAAVSTFNADTEPPVYDVTQTGSAPQHAVTTTLNNGGYRTYVRVWSDHNAKSDWAYKDVTINAPSPGVPGDDNAGDSGTPGVGVPSAIPDTYTSSAQLRMRDASNLLSVNQADFEIASDALEWTATGASLARVVSKAFGTGEASMSITATSTSDITVETTFVEISPSLPLTLRAQTLTAVTGRSVSLFATFYDATFTAISSSAAVQTTDAATTWKELVSNVTAPAGATYLKLKYQILSPALSEVHYIDHCGVMYGTNSAWTDGGHQSHNLLSSYLATADDPESNVEEWEQGNSATTVTRTAVTGTGGHGLLCQQMQYVGAAANIAYRATGTVFTSPTSGTNYTLNKPAGTVQNDLLLAFVTSSAGGAIVPPAGWSLVSSAIVDDDASYDVSLHVLKRTAVSSDPSSWSTGKLATASSRRTAVVVGYSGAAHADDQFIAESIRKDSGGNPVHRTQIITNTDPNGWRVGAFAASDDNAGATFSANRVSPPGSDAPPIAFVGSSSKWVQHSNTTSFTIHKPTGVVSGDLMIASVVMSGYAPTVTPPSGWTLVKWHSQPFSGGSDGGVHSGDVTVAILKRTAGSSEPASWTGSHSAAGQPKVTQVVAYRNCDIASAQFIAQNSAGIHNTSRVPTPEVTNTDSNAWRVCMFGATTPFASSWSSGDVAERCDSSTSLDGFPDAVLSFSDSGGPISTGTHKRTGQINSISNSQSNVPSGNFFAGVGWIGILKPLSGPPAQPGNETERVDNTNGASSPWVSTAVYDSNGVVPAGATGLYGQFAGAGNGYAGSMASWIGILRPASSIPAGVASARPNVWVDISEMDPDVLDLAGNKVTVAASFLGTTDGTPLVGVEFARANQPISDAVTTGAVFGTVTWTKAWATFAVPAGTTRMRPVLSAVGRELDDIVRFDRVGLMLGAPAAGETPVWRNGTSRREHPVWSKPIIQYSDDAGIGYESWRLLPGQKLIPPAFRADTGQLAYVDHSIIPLNSRKYRVQTMSYGLNGEVFSSGWGPESNEVSFTALNWWLKDFSDLSTSLRLRVKYEDVQVTTDNTASVFQPLGEDYPIVMTEGYKADSLTISVFCDRQEEAALFRLLRANRTLLLQSDTDYAWWVRPVDALTVNNLAVSQLRRTTDPVKLITCKFVQVKPEE
ncbi:hypothetical protein [Streptomyces hydrogenans]|uniref:Minor tail protein n=1 Tax=Streptomyces hydrogenans TaxID=1873719 RepID=A0ABQ3PJS6_9ACTN|nr:hypothetical protein [Streptomyces hydrogenans]GHG09678.1 hypothetical protein GCM10018784_22820 [Streptomyces hydrogenans]GHI25266.1 hypothetical protein Shyd_66370 [Streptomyces hydrogenans]